MPSPTCAQPRLERAPVREPLARPLRRRFVVPVQRCVDVAPDDRPPRPLRAVAPCLVERGDGVDVACAQPRFGGRPEPREVSELECLVHLGDVARSPYDCGVGLVRLGRGLGEERVRGDPARDRDHRPERLGDRRFHLIEDRLGLVARRKLGGEFVDGVGSCSGEHRVERARDRVVGRDVEFGALVADCDVWDETACLLGALALAEPAPFRRGIDRDEHRGAVVGVDGRYADGAPVERGFRFQGCFLRSTRAP